MAQLSEPTLNRLLTDVRLQLNQPNESNSFWKNNELTSYINDAIAKYFVDINEVAEGQFDAAPVYLDVVSGQEAVDLPEDCFEVRAVYAVQPNGNVLLKFRNNLTQGYVQEGSGGISGYAPYYYFRGEQLVLRPLPQFSQTGALLLEYTQFPETLITGQDSLTRGISPVFKELVVMYCVYKAKLKESMVQGGDTYLPAERHLSTLYAAFKQQISSRSKFPQDTVPYNVG